MGSVFFCTEMGLYYHLHLWQYIKLQYSVWAFSRCNLHKHYYTYKISIMFWCMPFCFEWCTTESKQCYSFLLPSPHNCNSFEDASCARRCHGEILKVDIFWLTSISLLVWCMTVFSNQRISKNFWYFCICNKWMFIRSWFHLYILHLWFKKKKKYVFWFC